MTQVSQITLATLDKKASKSNYIVGGLSFVARVLFILTFLFAMATGAQAQTTGTCSASDKCFNFDYKFIRSSDNQFVTLTIGLKTTCGNALSHISFELPKDVQVTNFTNSNNKFKYKKGEYTTNPFYSLNVEVNGEGIKNGEGDTFSYTMTAQQFSKLTTFRVLAKTANTVATVAFNGSGCTTTACAKPTTTLSGPSTLCNVSDDVYTFTAGPAQTGVTYLFTLPEGFYILEGEGTNTIKVQVAVSDEQLSKPQTLVVSAVNSCGSVNSEMNVIVKDCGDAGTLPVELTSFVGKASSGKVNLNWSTASEKNNDRFEVERSSNGVDFVKIAEVKGSGNSLVTKTYSYVDAQAVAGTSYYRLKQVDFDGAYEYSKMISVEIKSSATKSVAVASAYPNPFQGNVMVNFTLPENGTTSISFYNLSGQVVMSKQVTGNAGVNETAINGLDNLANGIYIMKVSSANQTATQRLVKSY